MREKEEKKIIIDIIHLISFFVITAFIIFTYNFGYWEGIKKGNKETHEIYQKELQSSIYKQDIE